MKMPIFMDRNDKTIHLSTNTPPIFMDRDNKEYGKEEL